MDKFDSNPYYINLTGEGSIKSRLQWTKSEDIPKLKKILKTIEEDNTKEQLHNLEKIISASGKQIADVGDEKYSNAQKSIRENYIAIQKENKEFIKDLSQDVKSINNNVKVISHNISKKESEIDKMIKKIEHVVGKRDKKSGIFKNPTRSDNQEKKIREEREDSARKITSGFATKTEFIFLKDAENSVNKVGEYQRKLVDKIVDLRMKHQQEKDAVKDRLDLAGKIHKSITNIDEIIEEHTKESKKSTQILIKHLEKNIFPKLELEKEKLLQFEKGLMESDYDFNISNDSEMTNEEQFIESLTNGLKESEKMVKELNGLASDARSIMPTKSKILTESKISRRGSAILSNLVRTPSQKDVNDQIKSHINNFNRKLVAYSDSVLNNNPSAGTQFGELEVLNAKIKEMQSNYSDKISSENKVAILTMNDKFTMFTNVGKMKETALEFSYSDIIESNILVYSKNLVEYLTFLKGPKEELYKKPPFNPDAGAKNFETYQEKKHDAIVSEMEGIDNYIQKMKTIAEKHHIEPSSSMKETLKYYENLKDMDDDDLIKAAKDFIESKVTAESLGMNIEQKYQFAFDGVLQNPNKIPLKGILESIPIFQVKHLEGMLKSMERIDHSNHYEYAFMLKNLRELDEVLLKFKEYCKSSKVDEMLIELDYVDKKIKNFLSEVEEMEFGINKENTFYGGKEEAQSFGEKNKAWLLDRLHYSSSLLDSIKKHAEKVEDKSILVSGIPLAPESVEVNIANGRVSRDDDYKLNAFFTGGTDSFYQFLKDTLTYFKEREGIDQPYIQLQETKRYVYLNDKGEVEKLMPKELEKMGLQFESRNKVSCKFDRTGEEI